MAKIVVIQGPNLNMLGVREQNIYGPMKLEQIHAQMKEFADKNSVEIEFFQSNLEGEIVDRIQECLGDADGIIINPAAYTHTSNIHRREEFRQKNMIAPVCASSVVGFGPFGYHLAMTGMTQIFSEINAMREAQKAQQAAQTAQA